MVGGDGLSESDVGRLATYRVWELLSGPNQS